MKPLRFSVVSKMSTTALILCPGDTRNFRVAGLALLERLIVAAHRATGLEVTVVISGELPRLRRARALGIQIRVLPTMPELIKPTLVLSTHCLVQASDLKKVIQETGRLVNDRDEALPVGVVPRLGPDEEWLEALNALPRVRAEGVAVRVTSRHDLVTAERLLWRSLTSSSDGLVDRYFNRPIGRWFSKLLVFTALTPNQVSVGATLLGVYSAWLFALGNHAAALWGAILLQVSAMIDCVDGDLARVMYRESKLGKWLDIVGDQVVHFSLFLGIGIGLWRAQSASPVLVLGGVAAIGVVLSFLVVLRGLRQPESQRNARLHKMIEATANRDFSVLLIFLVLIHQLEIFLWMTAIGVHLFWMIALAVPWFNQPETPDPEASREDPA